MLWRDFDRLPEVMSHLESVECSNETHSHWIAKGLLGTKIEWDAEIINDVENELIAWKSLPGGDVDTAGSVHFEAVPTENVTRTRIHLSLKYNPSGGKLSVNVLTLLGEDLEQILDEDPAALKQRLDFPVDAHTTPYSELSQTDSKKPGDA